MLIAPCAPVPGQPLVLQDKEKTEGPDPSPTPDLRWPDTASPLPFSERFHRRGLGSHL